MTKENHDTTRNGAVTGSGVECTLIITATYAGCGGYNGSDADEQGRSLYARPGWYSEEELDADAETWESLWPRHDTLTDTTAAALAAMGLTAPQPPAEAVPWDDAFPGTRQEWELASKEAATTRRTYTTALQEVTGLARATWLRSRGWTPLRGWASGAYMVVHDFGCRCGGRCGSYWDAFGRGVVVTRGDVTYFVNRGADIDELLAQGEKARTKASAQTHAEITNLLSQMDDEQLLQAAKIALPDGDLDHAAWVRGVKEKAASLRSSITARISRNDYSEACTLHWPDHHFRRSPDDAGVTAYNKVLEDGGADVLDAAVATELLALLDAPSADQI